MTIGDFIEKLKKFPHDHELNISASYKKEESVLFTVYGRCGSEIGFDVLSEKIPEQKVVVMILPNTIIERKYCHVCGGTGFMRDWTGLESISCICR